MVARDGIEEGGKWLVFGCESNSDFVVTLNSYPGDF
jgi:hypothetical protein